MEALLLALAPRGMLSLVLLAPRSAKTSTITDSKLSGLARTLVENGESAYSMGMATLGGGESSSVGRC